MVGKSLPVTISLSDKYDSDSADSLCTKVIDREEGGMIGYSETYQYSCQLNPSKTYYFRVSGDRGGSY